jgi:hypothetical protein
MSIVRVGTTKKYADGWEMIFGNKRKTTKKTPRPTKKAKKKTAARKK